MTHPVSSGWGCYCHIDSFNNFTALVYLAPLKPKRLCQCTLSWLPLQDNLHRIVILILPKIKRSKVTSKLYSKPWHQVATESQSKCSSVLFWGALLRWTSLTLILHSEPQVSGRYSQWRTWLAVIIVLNASAQGKQSLQYPLMGLLFSFPWMCWPLNPPPVDVFFLFQMKMELRAP
jgi:hypothetical protein